MRLLAAPDRADDWVEHVIHDHAPTGDITKRGVNFLADIGKRGTGAGVGARHAAIADRGEQHSDHGNQNCSHHVAAAAIAENAKHRHRRDRLNHDNAVQN